MVRNEGGANEERRTPVSRQNTTTISRTKMGCDPISIYEWPLKAGERMNKRDFFVFSIIAVIGQRCMVVNEACRKRYTSLAGTRYLVT
jgi:hypothetical protein